MKRYFICSDIHSFYDEWMHTLNEFGFEKDNPDHIVVVAGDLFDRGDQSVECYNFAKEMKAKNRFIYIIGNHEFLLFDALHKDYPQDHDRSNGTVKTICHLAGYDYEKFQKPKSSFGEAILEWSRICTKVLALGVDRFIQSSTVNYLELGKYIIVHGFIPLRLKNITQATSHELIYSPNSEFEYNPNWREDATRAEWFGSTWFNPAEKYDAGFFAQEAQNDKYLIVGHWGAFLIHKHYHGGLKKHHEICTHEKMICLDATTVLSHKVNCFVIEL